jgi:hypothetical protein
MSSTTGTRTRKTTAKRTAAKRTTTPAKKAAAAKPVVPVRDTVVDMRKPLPVRRPRATGPYSAQELTEARACLASAMARLPIPVLAWHTLPNERASARLADGTLIVHTAHRDPVFTAHVTCPHGAVHAHQVTDPGSLHAARTATKACTERHGSDDQTDALTRGVGPVPKPPAVHPLGEGLHRARAARADTEGLSLTDIAAGLHARANADHPQEHPTHD